ncbi:30S ribosomal protein S20 [Candidatus Falkowbacteria bacterium]|nr:30S ribosomal protein S20 [Candidatus Falkowbacteria bacterium]
MPIKQKSKEALRKSKRHLARNTKIKGDLKTLLKKIRKDIDSKKADKEIETLIKQAQKAIDKAAQKGIIKKNSASRKLSRLVKYYKKGGKIIEKKVK